jgi:tRNA-dihydrouridine synthase A
MGSGGRVSIRQLNLKMLHDQSFRFSVAPMMDWTDRHCRVFHRRLSRKALLYTEMVTTGAVLHGPRERLLGFSNEEQPVALQLGGSDPKDLAEAARIGAGFGYSEINLNVGCPSDRVQDGRFGACLMQEPRLVGACVAAMKAAVDVPVTVNCRIGVDDQDPDIALNALTDHAVGAGVDGLVVHARKAWLEGLSPKENRDVPPLDYTLVWRLKERLPDLPIAINGGIETLEAAKEHLEHVDGVMFGRAAYHNPGLLAEVDAELFGTGVRADPRAAAESMVPYIAAHIARGGKVSNVTRHMLGLFAGLPGARAYRRHLATEAVKPGATETVLTEALALVRSGGALAAA